MASSRRKNRASNGGSTPQTDGDLDVASIVILVVILLLDIMKTMKRSNIAVSRPLPLNP